MISLPFLGRSSPCTFIVLLILMPPPSIHRKFLMSNIVMAYGSGILNGRSTRSTSMLASIIKRLFKGYSTGKEG